MSWDIYGERLRSGHCEAHPHVHEEYPCHLCVIEGQQRQAEQAEWERHCNEQAQAHYARMIGDDECGSWPPLNDAPRRSPLSQETVERIRRCIELREHRDLDVWAEHEAEPMLRDLLAEIEGKQS